MQSACIEGKTHPLHRGKKRKTAGREHLFGGFFWRQTAAYAGRRLKYRALYATIKRIPSCRTRRVKIACCHAGWEQMRYGRTVGNNRGKTVGNRGKMYG